VTFGSGSTGTLALAGNSVTVANLSTHATPGTTFVQNANGSAVSNATLTVGNSTNASGTYAGTLQNGTGGGTLALTKAGTGTLSLSGSNTFSGGVTINAGRLNANNASALSSNTVAMTGASTTLSFGTGTGSVTTFSNPINVTGTATGTTLIVATNAKVSLNAAITIAADTTIQGTGTDNQIGTTALGTITSSNNSNLTIAVNNSQTHVFAGKIDLGTGSVTRSAGSNANLTLSNANNSFSGGLFIGSVGNGLGGAQSGATTITTNGAQGSGDITFITGNTAPITFSNVSGSVANNIVSTGGTGGLIKTGASTMTLTGTNTYTGTTTVSGGSLIINGAVASTSVVVDGALGGSGVMENATLSGSGSINPGNSPGILTAAATNPSGGLDYNFEFTAANSLPTWNAPTASVNDVLRLTSATPFSSTMDSDNVISIYLNVPSFGRGRCLHWWLLHGQ
jgi:fibronectin-binding autotransporter adhesin